MEWNVLRLMFFFEDEVIVRTDLPEGCSETFRVEDESEEVWDAGFGA